MSRPPCCEKVGIKKGPWTPEEDIILVSYIREHGPGNWRSVSAKTGLMRNSQSCRLRWTNYLRPGIKRGNFTTHEEDIIVQLQSLLGNKWAAIASYFPQRTDGDIKNYWYTQLKKKLDKQQAIISSISAPLPPSEPSITFTPTITSCHHVDRHRYIPANPLSMDSYARPASSKVTQLISYCAPIGTNDGYYSCSSSDGSSSMSSSAINNNPLFYFDRMSSGAALPPISDVPKLTPLPQQLSSIEDWLLDEATKEAVHQLMEISDGGC